MRRIKPATRIPSSGVDLTMSKSHAVAADVAPGN